MKKLFSKFLLPLLGFVCALSIVVSPIAEQLHINPAAITFGLVAGAFAYHIISPRNNGNMQLNGIEVEVWANYIIERFWKDNTFIQRAFSDDDKVLAGKIVHIPQPGSLPVIVKNRTILPASVIRRADADIVYVLDEYSTNPTVITQADKIELSYDKINSVYGDHAGVISQDVAGDMILKWLTDLPQSNVYYTTGAATAELGNSAFTGTRKAVLHNELMKIDRDFNKNNVPKEGRQIMYPSYMLQQLKESLSNTQYRDFSAYFDAKEGIIGRLYNFDILERSDVATATGVGATCLVNPYGAAPGVSDSEVAIAWQKDAVARALGEVKFFENLDRAEYQGDVYSSYLRAGGRRRRADNLGVAMLVQAL